MARDSDEETLRTEVISDDDDDNERRYINQDDSDAYRSDSDVQQGAREIRSARERKYATLKPPIASLCSALGGVEEFRTEQGDIYSAYSLGDQVVGCLKDLKRFWRMDDKDDDRTVARIFFDVGVLNNDLIPILLTTLGTSTKGDRIALAFELMAAMTWPINAHEEILEAKSQGELQASRDYHTLLNAQRQYKNSILRTGCLRAIFQLMSPSLAKSRRDRSRKDENIISLVMFTFRNLAAIRDKPATSDSAAAFEMSTLQSEYIRQLADEQIFDLLIAMAQNANSTEFSAWNVVTLDIFHLIFRSVKPAELMVPVEKIDENKLKDLLNVEGQQRRTAGRTNNSRHSRFTTTLALKTGKNQYIVHKQKAVRTGAEGILDDRKKDQTRGKVRIEDELAPPSHLRPEAIQCLRDVAVAFIDSAFNPFFASLLKDIRTEKPKIQQTDRIRFLFLTRFFMEFFLLLYQQEQIKSIDPQSDEGHDFDLIAEMTDPQSIGFVAATMNNAMQEKPILWLDLQAGMDCFTQILLVVEAMTASNDEDNVKVAQVLQDKIYYENVTLQLALTIIASFKAQSHKFLDSTVHLAYTLLRTLEKYSKSKAFMFVRKKSTKRANKGDDYDDGDEGARKHSFAEHAFQFEDYESASFKFAVEASLTTFLVYLESYRNLNEDQLKRIVALLHRIAIKAKSEVLFFKPSVLELFKRILEDDQCVTSRQQPLKDLKKLIEFILRKFFKTIEERPFMLIEAFFPKSSGQIKKAREGETNFYESSDDDGPGFKFKQGEVEVQPGYSLSDQIGIVVTALVESGQVDLVEFVKSQLTLASASRTQIVLTTDEEFNLPNHVEPDSDESLRLKAEWLRRGPSEQAKALFEPHNVKFETDDTQQAGSDNSQFKLLMRLLQWESDRALGSDVWQWVIPVTLMPKTLDGDIKMIENFQLDPINPQGKTAADLLRKKRKTPVRRSRRGHGRHENESSPELDDNGNEQNSLKEKKKKKSKQLEQQMVFKSAQFIEDSDDDEEADARFFAMEAELRAKMAAGSIGTQMSSTQTARDKKKQNKADRKKSKTLSTNKERNGDADNLNGRIRLTKKQKQEQNKQRQIRIEANLNAGLTSNDESDDDEEVLETLRRGISREKAAQVAQVNNSDSSDSDDQGQASKVQATKSRGSRGSSAEASATNSSHADDDTSSSMKRKRRMSATSATEDQDEQDHDLDNDDLSDRPSSSQQPRMIVFQQKQQSHMAVDDDDDESDGQNAVVAVKKRRVVLDSDEDE
ncbi:Topoisomerase 1-associated factor 1 [Microbotryomycetes sp. JL221]|nr:Topoisomerase 1-associated factor 1 [Microbotryomycetes sp. JL221]